MPEELKLNKFWYLIKTLKHCLPFQFCPIQSGASHSLSRISSWPPPPASAVSYPPDLIVAPFVIWAIFVSAIGILSNSANWEQLLIKCNAVFYLLKCWKIRQSPNLQRQYCLLICGDLCVQGMPVEFFEHFTALVQRLAIIRRCSQIPSRELAAILKLGKTSLKVLKHLFAYLFTHNLQSFQRVWWPL